MKNLILATAVAISSAMPVYADKASNCADTANIAGAVAVARDQGMRLSDMIGVIYQNQSYTSSDRMMLVEFTSKIYNMGLSPDVTIKFVYDMCMAPDA